MVCCAATGMNTSLHQAELAAATAQRRTFAIIEPSGCGKDHADGKAVALFGHDPDRGNGPRAKGGKVTASDWMGMEQERGISITASAMQFGYKGAVVNLSTPWPPRFFRRHLPDTDGRGQRNHGDRCGQGCRDPDTKIICSLSIAAHSGPDSDQQDGLAGSPAARFDDRSRTGAQYPRQRDQLAGRVRKRLYRHRHPGPTAVCICSANSRRAARPKWSRRSDIGGSGRSRPRLPGRHGASAA